ncbi:hypothetical protein ScalyP_jg2601 [Parmales sp. scaly parma]|nr:hypothetical protein ScalyP_jg2601 [Parmales sp. scaly parma]
MNLRFRKLLVVVKQTAFEEYTALKLQNKAPRALRWPRLKQRYETHNSCVDSVIKVLKTISSSSMGESSFSVVNRVDLDRQHLQGVDLVVAVGGDGTVLSCSHLLDNGTIPLLGINSDPSTESDKKSVCTKKDERRSFGALCMLTSEDLDNEIDAARHMTDVIYNKGEAIVSTRKRIQVTIKSSYSETKLVPGLNDILIANPIPAAVSRFRMGSATNNNYNSNNNNINNINNNNNNNDSDDIARFNGSVYKIESSFNVWSSGMWVCTATGSTAAMLAAGGRVMHIQSPKLQYKIREHLVDQDSAEVGRDDLDFGITGDNEHLHLRWNSHLGKIYIDGSHLSHDIQLGDEILINNRAPSLDLFIKKSAMMRYEQQGAELVR